MPIEDLIYPLLPQYTSSPQWVKNSLGRAYSWIPKSWRYGAEFATFAHEIAMSKDVQWTLRRSEEKLNQTLSWAIKTVPAYETLKNILRLDRSADERLHYFPLLAKEKIKANNEAFLSKLMPKSSHFVTYTGGSTSIPMKLYHQKFVSRAKDFAYAREFDKSIGIGRDDIILAMRGRTVPKANSETSSIWMYDPIKRYLHLSSDHLEPRYMSRYVNAIRRFRPAFIHAFPSAIYPLAKWLELNPAPDISLMIRGIQLFSENIYRYQIDLLEKVFDCPVLMDYGHSERAVKAVSLVDDKRYFFWPLYGKVELIDSTGASILEPGRLGEIVATGFDNPVMPLIRYKTGDLGMWSATPSGQRPGFSVIENIDGRLQEFLVCHGGRLVSIATIGAAHFEQLAGVDRMQFEQLVPGRAVLKICSSSELLPNVKSKLVDAIRKKTQGDLDIDIVRVEEIPRTVSGKHRLLVQAIDLSGFLGAAY